MGEQTPPIPRLRVSVRDLIGVVAAFAVWNGFWSWLTGQLFPADGSDGVEHHRRTAFLVANLFLILVLAYGEVMAWLENSFRRRWGGRRRRLDRADVGRWVCHLNILCSMLFLLGVLTAILRERVVDNGLSWPLVASAMAMVGFLAVSVPATIAGARRGSCRAKTDRREELVPGGPGL